MLQTDLTAALPAAVADVTSVDDVRAAVDDARRRGLRVAVQATGHGTAGLGDVAGALIVRTAGLTGIAVDPEAATARVAAGHPWRDVHAALDPLGLAAVGTAHPGVGVAGTILGGGIGWLARRHGLAADAVAGIELVVADGRVLHADDQRERDLFWALRGGGGGLGVITAVQLRLLPIGAVHAGALTWAGPRVADVLHTWARWTATLPDELTSIARLRRTAAGVTVAVEGAFLGDAAAAAEWLAPLRALQPAHDSFATVAPGAVPALHDEPAPTTPRRCEHLLVDELPAPAVDALLDACGPGAGFPLDELELRHLGGALCRTRPGAGALGSLDAEIVCTALAPAARAAAVEETLDALAPWAAGHLHGSFATRRVDPHDVFTADAVRRLRAVKALHDPEDRFLAPYTAAVAR